MFRTMTGLALVLSLAACSDANQMSGGDMGSMDKAAFATAPAAAPMEFAASESAPADGFVDLDRQVVQPDPNGGGGAPPGTAPMMAYSYAWNFSVPSANM